MSCALKFAGERLRLCLRHCVFGEVLSFLARGFFGGFLPREDFLVFSLWEFFRVRSPSKEGNLTGSADPPEKSGSAQGSRAGKSLARDLTLRLQAVPRLLSSLSPSCFPKEIGLSQRESWTQAISAPSDFTFTCDANLGAIAQAFAFGNFIVKTKGSEREMTASVSLTPQAVSSLMRAREDTRVT